MSHSFAMQIQMKASKGRGNELSAFMLQAADAVKHLSGCQLFVVIQGMSDPDQLMLTQIWDSQAAHEAFLSNREIAAIVNAARPLIAQMEHQVGRPLTAVLN